MKRPFTAPEEKPDVSVDDELFDKPAPVEPKAKVDDHAALVLKRDTAQAWHSGIAQLQTLAEIEADAAARDFSTRFTELMSTAPRARDEIDAAYKLALDARDIAEEKANAQALAQAATAKALSDYLDAYYNALVAERKTT